jgi:YVTN family beta-propeller protein
MQSNLPLYLGTALSVCLSLAAPLTRAASPDPITEPVGRAGTNRMVTPVNQVVTPLGRQVELPGLRPQALALSPDGRWLAVAGKTSEVVILEAATGALRQRVALPSDAQNEPQPDVASPNILQPDTKGQVSFTGLIFSRDGRWLYLSNVNGSIKVFTVAADGTVKPSHSLALPPAGALRRKEEIPAGLALSPDSTRLYVCGNLSNQLLELDTATGQVLRTFAVGVAPYDAVLVGPKAYVSNWGGGRPKPGDVTGPAGRGTEVKVDPVRNIACEGSVSVVNLAARSGSRPAVSEIRAQLHASALAVSPDRRYVVCANAASDNLSVIDTRSDAVVETIWVKQSPADLFGASPNALCFAPDGKTLFAANGTQNAVAVLRFSPQNRSSKLLGLIPVGWFPGALALDARHKTLCVANLKGHPGAPRTDRKTGELGFNSHHYSGSMSLVALPKAKELPSLSARVYKNYRHERIAPALASPRPGQPPRPVPERTGEPSPIRHIVYIIKENRTYDQVLGDVKAGNGDASLCIFGERITPNQHRFVRDFVLLDNTYCCGILSADGHQWSTTAIGTDYLEKSFAGWPRSYPDGMGEDENDALAYSPAGFIWDNALNCLPNDHTSGTSRGSPTPAACAADNDLAFGQIVDALSHSRFWKSMAILGIEDDPQGGWDHVSGYRTTAYVISPWAKRHAVVSTQYNTTSLLRTMEQILGLPPMNQFDATATPMADCFTNIPDFTPYIAVTNNVALNEMNPAPKVIQDATLRRNAYASARLNFRQVDAAPEAVLNRILWQAMKGSAAPYPSWVVNVVEDKD